MIPIPNFETKLVLITPHVAKQMLERNTNNRSLTIARVNEFVDLIITGRFQCTHQGIAIDSSGIVIDGQHRLAAIVKTGISVYMLVSYGMKPDSRLAVDTGKPRTALAISKLMGRSDSTHAYAIARVLKYGPVKASQMHVAPEDVFAITDTFNDGIQFVLDSGGINIVSTVAAVIARASYTKDRAKLARFIDVFKSETPANESEISPIKLKIAIVNASSTLRYTKNGTRYTNVRQYIYQLTESAIVDFLKGYPTKVLKPSTQEKFKLPPQLDGYNP